LEIERNCKKKNTRKRKRTKQRMIKTGKKNSEEGDEGCVEGLTKEKKTKKKKKKK
jgi:hypothetical protein